MIEFIAWYQPGKAVVRCGGDSGCGALLVAGDDARLHLRWHEKIDRLVQGNVDLLSRVHHQRPGRILGA